MLQTQVCFKHEQKLCREKRFITKPQGNICCKNNLLIILLMSKECTVCVHSLQLYIDFATRLCQNLGIRKLLKPHILTLILQL